MNALTISPMKLKELASERVAEGQRGGDGNLLVPLAF